MDPSLPTGSNAQRPDPPWGPAGPGLAWHHIIPYALLRDVWNRLVERQINTQLPIAKTTIYRYLVLLDPALSTDRTVGLDKLIDRMRAVNTNQARARHNPLTPLQHAEVDRLREAAAWPAWDVVAGWTPEHRSDDPRPGFAEHFTFGLTAWEERRMKALMELFKQLQAFVRAPADENAFRALNWAIANAQPFVRWCNEPIRYRPEMWVRDNETGQYRKRYLQDKDNPFFSLL